MKNLWHFLIAFILCVIVTPSLVDAGTHDTQITERYTCLEFDDAAAMVDIQVDGTKAEIISLVRDLGARNKCGMFDIIIPSEFTREDIRHIRQKGDTTIAVVLVTLPNGDDVFIIVFGKIVFEDEPEEQPTIKA